MNRASGREHKLGAVAAATAATTVVAVLPPTPFHESGGQHGQPAGQQPDDLGPNGAGKTTTVEILEGYRHRDAGDVAVLGHDPGRERTALAPRIGMALQETAVEPYRTVRETVGMYAGFYPHRATSTR